MSSIDDGEATTSSPQKDDLIDNDSDDSDDASETAADLDDLDAQLASLDIDNDFQMSFLGGGDNSENESPKKKEKTPEKTKESSPKKKKEPSPQKKEPSPKKMIDLSNPKVSKQQLARPEVFSKHYSPTTDEDAVLQDLIIKLSAKSMSAPTVLTQLLNIIPHDYGKSILLKRGIVDHDGGTARDLLLFTHGFVVTSKPLDVQESGNFLFGSLMFSKAYLCCHLYTSVEHVKDLWQLQQSAFSVKLNDGTEMRFDIPKQEEEEEDATTESAKDTTTTSDTTTTTTTTLQQALTTKRDWLQAWERVLLQRPCHLSADEREARIVGWQHALLQTSLYTAAVTGQDFYNGRDNQELLNKPDTYNGLAPLHYAALHNQVHVIEHLLQEMGADPEVKDEDGRTPMYYGEFLEVDGFVSFRFVCAIVVVVVCVLNAMLSSVLYKECSILRAHAFPAAGCFTQHQKSLLVVWFLFFSCSRRRI